MKPDGGSGHVIRLDEKAVRFIGHGPARAGQVHDRIVAVTFTNLALEVLKPIAGNVPIVFCGVGDPVGSGFVASLARPGGNITGFASYEPSMGGKWLGVLKEAAPNVIRALVIMHPETPVHQGMWRSVEQIAPRLGIEATAGGVHNAAEIKHVIELFAQKPNGGLIAFPHALTIANAPVIIDLARRYRMPDVYAVAETVAGGGLVSYGINADDQFRSVGEYVDRILKGAKPSDLAVQNPTRFKLAVNLRAAKVIGLTIPEIFLLRADEVIE